MPKKNKKMKIEYPIRWAIQSPNGSILNMVFYTRKGAMESPYIGWEDKVIKVKITQMK